MSIPNKSSIVKHWRHWLISNLICLSEPACWACKDYWWGKYDIKNESASIEEILSNWNEIKPLERCHIIPKHFGGSDTVDNLFLMCKSCHDKAPNTRSKEAFFIWVDRQNFLRNFFESLEKELKTFGLSDRLDEINSLFKDGIPSGMKENLGVHFNSRTGPELTVSTFVAAISEYLLENKM